MPIHNAQRILGALKQFNGAGTGAGSSGGGGSRLTISNNSDGRLLKANGSVSSITALSELNFDGSEFDITTDVYIQGSGNNLFLDGTAVDGTSTKFKIEIVGGALRVVPT
tara:strand:- start:9 stop:338 length:330 start_codon:yes stop_codon:yes gene_type:complete